MKELAGSFLVLLVVCGPLWAVFAVVVMVFASRLSSQFSRDRGEQDK